MIPPKLSVRATAPLSILRTKVHAPDLSLRNTRRFRRQTQITVGLSNNQVATLLVLINNVPLLACYYTINFSIHQYLNPISNTIQILFTMVCCRCSGVSGWRLYKRTNRVRSENGLNFKVGLSDVLTVTTESFWSNTPKVNREFYSNI